MFGVKYELSRIAFLSATAFSLCDPGVSAAKAAETNASSEASKTGDASADENFQVEVYNLAWLAGRLEESPDFWLRGMLIVRKINTKHVENALQKLVKQFNGSPTWPIFTEGLNKYLHWEYEDIDDYQGSPDVPDSK